MKGDVIVAVRTAMPERLVERAIQAGMRFTAAAPRADHELWVTLGNRDAKRFLELCSRFSIPTRVVSRRGGSAFLQWFRQRWTAGLGLLAGLLICLLWLSRIWMVDICFTGDAAGLGDPSAIMQQLEAMEIRPGISRQLDLEALSGELLASMDGLTYASARIEGVRLLVEAAPEVPSPEIYDVSVSRNLYAGSSGIVDSINVETGVPCVKPGDTVRRGQLLIRGIERISKENTHPIAALGKVMIRTWIEGSAEAPVRQTRIRYTGRQSSSCALSTPWLELPITNGETFTEQSTSIKTIPLGGLYMPVCLMRTTRLETEVKETDVGMEWLKMTLATLAQADARATLSVKGPADAKVTRTWTRYTQSNPDTLRASAVYEILTNAATASSPPHQGG